jgi:dihydrofolate reductase
VPKFVVSATMEGPLGWQKSTLIEGNVAEKLAELKRRPGKDITIFGSAALVRSLLRDGLLDELRLMVPSSRVAGSASLRTAKIGKP